MANAPSTASFGPPREPGLNYLCAGYKRFLTHIDSPMEAMAALLANGQSPARIMRLPAQRWIPGRYRPTAVRN
jgi:sulfatase maturation enzyme AslB (radical SAM superfamily)